jgi:phage-related tail protein
MSDLQELKLKATKTKQGLVDAVKRAEDQYNNSTAIYSNGLSKYYNLRGHNMTFIIEDVMRLAIAGYELAKLPDGKIAMNPSASMISFVKPAAMQKADLAEIKSKARDDYNYYCDEAKRELVKALEASAARASDLQELQDKINAEQELASSIQADLDKL